MFINRNYEKQKITGRRNFEIYKKKFYQVPVSSKIKNTRNVYTVPNNLHNSFFKIVKLFVIKLVRLYMGAI